MHRLAYWLPYITTAVMVVAIGVTVVAYQHADRPLARAEFTACVQKNQLVDGLNRQGQGIVAILSTAKRAIERNAYPFPEGVSRDQVLAQYTELITAEQAPLPHFDCEIYRERS